MTEEKSKIEAFIYTKDNGTRVSIAQWGDDGDSAWMSLIGGNGTMWVTFNKDEVKQLINAFQLVLKSND